MAARRVLNPGHGIRTLDRPVRTIDVIAGKVGIQPAYSPTSEGYVEVAAGASHDAEDKPIFVVYGLQPTGARILVTYSDDPEGS